MKIIIGKKYRFKKDGSVKTFLRGKVFMILSANRLQVYDGDGCVIRNAAGSDFFTYSSLHGLSKNIDHADIEPMKHIKKHVFRPAVIKPVFNII